MCSLCETYSIRRQQYFDMQLVGTMIEGGIGILLTENVEDFKPIEGIRAINPFVSLIS
jgi:predicted nucleic acid-binding protein